MSDERPMTHTQYRDEAPCREDHNFVMDEDGEFGICTRCGESESWGPEEAVPWNTSPRLDFE